MPLLIEPQIFGATIEDAVTGEQLTFDANLSETYSARSRVSSHPLETGSQFSDHVDLNNETISLRAIVSDTPITGQPEPGRAQNLYARLMQFRNQRRRLVLIFELRVFEDVVITMVTPRIANPSEAAVHIDIEFEAIVTVSPVDVFIPPEEVEEESEDLSSSEQDLGPQNAETLEQEEKVAALARNCSPTSSALVPMFDDSMDCGPTDILRNIAQAAGFD